MFICIQSYVCVDCNKMKYTVTSTTINQHIVIVIIAVIISDTHKSELCDSTTIKCYICAELDSDHDGRQINAGGPMISCKFTFQIRHVCFITPNAKD